MIPAVRKHGSTPSLLTLFTPPTEREEELFGEEGIAQQALRVARGFARGRGRSGDLMFVEECEAEALYIVVELIWEVLPQLKEKYPEKDERFKFYRMSVGYGLKAYFAHRATSTLSYLRKKGIVQEHFQLFSTDLAREFNDNELNLTLADACENEVERRVLDFKMQGNEPDMIATKCGLLEREVLKTLRRIKKRLLPEFRRKKQWKGYTFQNGKFHARIRVGDEMHKLGAYDTELEAAQAYNEAAVIAYGEDAKLNEGV